MEPDLVPSGVARAGAARQRLGRWLASREDVAAVVLTRPGSVAWATGAVAQPVDRTVGTDLVWVVVTRTAAGLVTTEVEADRVSEEYQPQRHGFTDLVAVPWYDPAAFARAAADLAGAPAAELAADGHPAFPDATDDLCALRLALSPAEQQDLRARVLRIERDVLAASRPPHRYGDVLGVLDRAYAREGAPGGWASHYQGGPIGYAQREFEIAPSQQDSRWYATPVEHGHAVAWNASLPGGAKAEDTYLVSPAGPERVTTAPATGQPWPTEDDDGQLPPRPAVLEVT